MMRIIHLCTWLLCASILISCQSTGTKVSDETIAKRAKLHYQIGLDALQRGQLAKGFEKLMQSNSELPKQPEVLDALAYAWRIRGDENKAESFYKQAILSGAGSSTFTNYGGLLVSLKRYQEAELQLRKALEDPRYRKQYMALILLGDALLGQHSLDQAIASYRQAGMMNPRQSLSQIKEAQAYVQFERLNYARALYETLLRKEPNNRQALEGFIQLLIKNGNLHKARKYLATYIEKTKNPLDQAWARDELTRLARMR